MTVRANKPAFNVREKLKELERPIGVKGNELLRAETAQDARDLVSAGRKNMIINGDMRISQRGTSTTSSSSNYAISVDRWKPYTGEYAVYPITSSQSSDVPSGSGFRNSLKYNIDTADTSPTREHSIYYSFEGQDLQHLKKGTANAVPVTLSFWCKASLAGTYITELMDNDNSNRHINKSYTINSANTWEYKTITFEGDTSGVLDNDNGNSFGITFWIAAASGNTSGTLQTSWGALSQSRRAVGQVNLAATQNNAFYLTGVQLEVGKNATEFEHRSYGEELALCQRYFQAFGYGSLCWLSPRSPQNSYTRYTYGSMKLKTTMRATPTIGVIGTNFQGIKYNGSGYSATTLSNPSSNMTLEYAGLDCVTPRPYWSSDWTVNDLVNFVCADYSTFLTFSAEL